MYLIPHLLKVPTVCLLQLEDQGLNLSFGGGGLAAGCECPGLADWCAVDVGGVPKRQVASVGPGPRGESHVQPPLYRLGRASKAVRRSVGCHRLKRWSGSPLSLL